MAHDVTNADAGLRDYLIGYYSDRRQAYVNTARQGAGEELERYILSEWTPLIDRLLDGEAILFSRFELPDDHPQSPKYGFDPGDKLILDEHDVLRKYEGQN